MKKQQHTQQVVYFKRWTRKRYAAFNSLHRVVIISTLSVACSIVACPKKASAQDSLKRQVNLEEIEVTEERPIKTDNVQMVHLQLSVSKTEIDRQQPQSLSNVLRHLQGLDVRQRGAFGTQADLSFRGGNFDQTAIFLNGINFTDPQTGHYSLNLPFSPDIISNIEVYKNTSPYLFGSSSFSGMVNILTTPQPNNTIQLSIDGGMYGLFRTGITVNFFTRKTKHLFHAGYERSDGYVENTDFRNLNLFYMGIADLPIGKIEAQAGMAHKNYGANGFYSLKYPNQRDSTQTFLASIKFVNKGKIKIIPSLYYRYQTDLYKLINGQPRERNNFHRSQVLGGNVLSYFHSKIGKTSLTLDYKIENIISTGIGLQLDNPVAIGGENDLFYRYGYTRRHYGVGLNHSFSWQNFDANGSFMMQHNTDNHDAFYYLPAFDLSYRIPEIHFQHTQWYHKAYLLVGKTMRMPTFTDLFYKTGDIIGNSNLKPEQAVNIELGYTYNLWKTENQEPVWEGQLAVFRRYGKNMIDYVKKETDSIWYSMNHTEVITSGIEFSTTVYPGAILGKSFFITDVSFRYAYLHSDKDSDRYLSRYVLDYLRHKFTIALHHTIIPNLSAHYQVTYQSRVGEFQQKNGLYASYPDYWLLDVGIQYQYKNWNFHIQANNVLNVDYFDIGGLLQPGIWIMGGMRYTLPITKSSSINK